MDRSAGLLSGDPEILGLACHSREVRPGYLFAAVPGSRVDGRAFIGDAVAAGAVAVLATPETRLDESRGQAILVTDPNPRRRIALMAACFHGGQPERVAAVTGTNGKTSVVTFLRRILTLRGRAAASMGTLGISAPGHEVTGSHTTPDPVALHRDLADLARRGVTHLAMEASSHGLDQHRLDGVRLAAAAFTNLTRDHLDYHGGMDAYLTAKARLFSELLPTNGVAVLNAETPQYSQLASLCEKRGLRVFDYGLEVGDIHCADMRADSHGWLLELSVFGRRHALTLPLIGEFQVANALCALALAVALGEDQVAATAALERLEGVRGRLQRAGDAVYVDYAHTPDALEAVLTALRSHTAERLRLVFGCGGDRDPGKRLEMGEIAQRLADDVIVTDDNPRGEEPALIRRRILDGCPKAREIGDRAQAIAQAVRDLEPGDLLVVAGKGHERGQTIAGTTLPFDDVEQVQKAIEEIPG